MRSIKIWSRASGAVRFLAVLGAGAIFPMWCWPVAAAPVTVLTVQDLQNIGNDLAGDYILGGNIDATGFGFSPIGGGTAFTGMLDGNGFAIDNLTINATGSYAGLFGNIGSTGKVSNLGLTGISIVGAVVGTGTIDVGGIAGSNSGTIASSYVNGFVAGSGNGSICNCGGISPAPGGTINVGGIAGVNNGTISSGTTTGTISGLGTDLVHLGGVAGINNGTISSSAATATVMGGMGGGNNGTYTLGGLAGTNNGTIFQSKSAGAVTHSGSDSDGGGLVGKNNAGAMVSQSFATVSVSGGTTNGGLVGWNQAGSIMASYATGSVNAQAGGGAGGLVDLDDLGGAISQSYSIGAVSGPNLGGLVESIGLGGGTVTNSYWDTQTSGEPTSAAGSGLTTPQFQSGTLPPGFDPSLWDATAGKYPALKWESGSSGGTGVVSNPVPEPVTMLVFLSGLLVWCAVRRPASLLRT